MYDITKKIINIIQAIEHHECRINTHKHCVWSGGKQMDSEVD